MSTTKPNNVSSTLLNVSAITNGALRVFTKEYARHLENRKPNYEIRHKYGKYRVIKYYGQDYEGAKVVARRLTKEQAEGYIKLLKED
jgi:hypothetical protein